MSTPEVRVERWADGTWRAECPCGERVASGWMRRETADGAAREHETTCATIQLARLQTRWDARDAALRALVADWRQIAADEAADPMTRHDAARITVMEACADRLEQALDGAR